MKSDSSVPVICRYRVKAGKATEFERVLRGHWATLSEAGLVTDEPARLYRIGDQAGNAGFIEMFAWREAESAQTAHETAAVMRLWEPMGALCEDMEFWNAEAIDG